MRTNNNIEGVAPWPQPPSLQTAPLVHPHSAPKQRGKLTVLQICLLSNWKLKRNQRRKYRELQTKLFDLWDKYEANEQSAKRLLKACSYLNVLRD